MTALRLDIDGNPRHDRTNRRAERVRRLMASVIVGGVALIAAGQGRAEMSAPCGDPASIRCADDRALRPLGLDLSGIAAANDSDRLWRAARAVVLTGQVSEPTQQAIWRRLWRVDGSLAQADAFDLHARDYAAAPSAIQAASAAPLGE